MTALTENTGLVERSNTLITRPVGGGFRIYQGAVVCIRPIDGYAVPAAEVPGLVPVGIAEHPADNSTGADGAITVTARKGCFRLANSAGADEITAASIGATAYLVDDATVARTDAANARSPAGRIVDVDDAGVFVEIR